MAVYGAFTFPQVPSYPVGAGLRHEYGTIVPPGGEVVAYVRSGGVQDGDHPDVRAKLVTTLNAALALCRSARGDAVVVLEGHAENISSADQMSSLVAGTRILGRGHGTARPTFTWTAATATFLLDVANVHIDNCILNMDPGTGSTTVAAPITVSAAGCAITNCQIRLSTDANSKTTIGVTTTAADLTIANCFVYGAADGAATTGFQFVGADRLRFVGNYVVAGTSANGVGIVRFLTTASTDVVIQDCIIGNSKSGSTEALTGHATTTGIIDRTTFLVNSGIAGAGTLNAFWVGRQVTTTDGAGTRAALFGTEST